MPAIAIRYEDMAQMDEDKAISFAKMTKGFAYAYQVFGSAYLEHKDKGEEYVLRELVLMEKARHRRKVIKNCECLKEKKIINRS